MNSAVACDFYSKLLSLLAVKPPPQLSLFTACAQKTEDELMEITLKMVGASTLLETQDPYPRNMAPGFIISASVLLPWEKLPGTALSPPRMSVNL